MMSLWIGASSGNLFGNIDLRVVQAGVMECWSVGVLSFVVLATDCATDRFDRAGMRGCAPSRGARLARLGINKMVTGEP
jgi:hypothetical protein